MAQFDPWRSAPGMSHDVDTCCTKDNIKMSHDVDTCCTKDNIKMSHDVDTCCTKDNSKMVTITGSSEY